MKIIHKTENICPRSFVEFFNIYHSGPYIAKTYSYTIGDRTNVSHSYLELPLKPRFFGLVKKYQEIAEIKVHFKQGEYSNVELCFTPVNSHYIDTFLKNCGRQTCELFTEHTKIPVEIVTIAKIKVGNSACV